MKRLLSSAAVAAVLACSVAGPAPAAPSPGLQERGGLLEPPSPAPTWALGPAPRELPVAAPRSWCPRAKALESGAQIPDF